MQLALMYVLPLIGLGAGVLAWFTQARGKFALALLLGEVFGFVILSSGG